MTTDLPGGTYTLGDLEVPRVGDGAMQLAGPHVFGVAGARAAWVAVLREGGGPSASSAPWSNSASPTSTPRTSTART